MVLNRRKLKENRTYLYIYPILKYYGYDLMEHLRNCFLLEVKLKDRNIKLDEPSLFLLYDIDNKHKSKVIQLFLDFLEDKEYFVRDYIYDSNSHVIVLKIPKIHHKAIDHFIKGEYSKMYSKKEIKEYFTFTSKDPKRVLKLKDIRQILNKNVKYLPEFIKKVNKEFGTNVSQHTLRNTELDFPPKKEEEILNFES